MAAVLQPIQDQIATLSAQVAELSKALKEGTDQGEIKGAEQLPPASLAALIMRQMSATWADSEAQIKGNTALAKAKPKETPAEEGRLGIPFIDQWLNEAPPSS